MNEVIKGLEVFGNLIELLRVEHQGSSSNCYSRWWGVDKITKSTRPVTQADVDELCRQGVFYCGQIVNATLNSDNTVSYSGECDSGG